jgi:mannitol-1-phosphate/altronate dehydrogenase
MLGDGAFDLAEGLRRRREVGTAPFAVMSCDTVADNGPAVRRQVLWVRSGATPVSLRGSSEDVAFPRTAVDRIPSADRPHAPRRRRTATGRGRLIA